MLRNTIAVVWLLFGAGWGFWVYFALVRRFGHRGLGRFVANWAGVTCYLIGMAGMVVLWNGGVQEAGWRRGRWADEKHWTWSSALATCGATGLLIGLLITWFRPVAGYASDMVPVRFSKAELAQIKQAETTGTPEERRTLAKWFLKEARLRLIAMPPEAQDFIDREMRRRFGRKSGGRDRHLRGR